MAVVGKSAIVDGIAMRIAKNEIVSLKGKKILQFSLNDLKAKIGGVSSEGIIKFIEDMLSLKHKSEPTRRNFKTRMPSRD